MPNFQHHVVVDTTQQRFFNSKTFILIFRTSAITFVQVFFCSEMHRQASRNCYKKHCLLFEVDSAASFRCNLALHWTQNSLYPWGTFAQLKGYI